MLIGRKGTIDKPQYIETPFWTIDTLFYTDIWGAYPKYIYYKFNTIKWLKYNEASGVPSLNANAIEHIAIILPPLPEQRAIASALSDVDALIEALDRLIDKKRKIKQGTMQQLLSGKKRLKGFGKSKGYKHTELGEIPEDWEVEYLNDLCNIYNGGTPSTSIPQYWDGEVAWCTPSEITRLNNKYITKTDRNITELGVKNSSATILPENSILLCTRATIGDMAINKIPMATNQGFKNLTPNYHTNALYLYYLLLTKQQKMIELSVGSTFLELSKSALCKIPLQIPPLPEQRAIASVLSDMDAEIEALEAKRNKYTKIKQGMMQDLLTGRVRLKF